jgi:hypothetical protein
MSLVTPILAAPQLDTTTWIAYALAVLAIGYIMLRSRAVKKDPLQRGTASSSLAQQRSVERQMQTLLVELSEMARSIGAGLDTRAAKLQALLDEADGRIAEVKSLLNNRPTSSAAVTTDRQPVTEHEAVAAESESDQRHAQVYAMADQGRNPHEIAAALGRQRGEIELILALRPVAEVSTTDR